MTAAVVAVVTALLIGGIGVLARRLAWEAENARKASHVALGLAALPLPWLFHSDAPVVALACAACAGLFALRIVPALRARFGYALHGIARSSIGEFAFAGGIALAFVLAHDRPAIYVAAILTLAFGDTAAALVGRVFGRHRYEVAGARKSVEGSCAFFAVALLVAAIAPAPLGLVSLVTFAAVTTLAEALSGNGFDNLLIPLAGVAALRYLPGASA